MSSPVPLPPTSAAMVEIELLLGDEPVGVKKRMQTNYCGKGDPLCSYLPLVRMCLHLISMSK